MRVILYKRVSTDEQATFGYSLEYQESLLVKYCEAKNYEIVQIYTEDFSGKDFNRPEFQKIVQYVKDNPKSVDIILFTKWDRYGRNVEQAIHYKNLLQTYGVEINAVEQPLDLNNSDNILVLNIYLSLGEVERLKIASRTKEGTIQARRNGYFTGKAPFGYVNARDEFKKPYLEIHPEEALFVKEAFERVAEGFYSAESIFYDLKRKGMRIAKQTYYAMFHNKTYCGLIHVPAHKGEPGRWIQGKHAGIVSKELFLKAEFQKTNHNKKGKIPQKEEPGLPLRNFLKCPSCGGNLTGSFSTGRNGKHGYYHCHAPCKVRFRSSLAHKVFVSYLTKVQFKEEFAKILSDLIGQTIKDNEGNIENEIRNSKNQLLKIEEQITRLDTEMITGKLSTEKYNKLSHMLEVNKQEIMTTINSLTIQKKKPKRQLIEKAVWILSNLSVLYERADYKGKRKILESMFPEKLIIENEQCRTAAINEMLDLISSISASFEQKKSESFIKNMIYSRLVPRAGIEPALPKEQDFESSASTSSATEASFGIFSTIRFLSNNRLSD